MNGTELNQVDAIYDASSRCRIEYHTIEYSSFQSFSESLNSFRRHLWQSGLHDDYWEQVLVHLVRFRTNLTIRPYSEVALLDLCQSQLSWLDDRLSGYDHSYPSLVTYVEVLRQDLANIPSRDSENMLKAILASLRQSPRESCALVLLRTHHISPTRRLLEANLSFSDFDVVNSTALRENRVFSRIILVGPPRWYPEFVFTAPRSLDIRVINFSWIGNTWNKKIAFSQRIDSAWFISGHQDVHGVERIDLDAKLPAFDFSAITSQFQRDIVETENEEFEDARIYLLEGGQVTFLENEPEASVTIIDLDENDENRVRYIKIKYLETGMFLLLRTEGGGDFIVSVADGIMGKHAVGARNMQREWKARLNHYVAQHGYSETARRLNELGSERANYPNLLRWLSSRSIKTHDPNDFRAILKIIDLEDQFEEYWQTMLKIVHAHQKAGFHIRRLLLEQVVESDLSDLNRTGVRTFDLGDTEAGSLTAFRILMISDETIHVPEWKIRELAPVEDNEWL